MLSREANIVVVSVVTGAAWAFLAVTVIDPMSHSLALAGAFLALLGLGGWALEIRAEGLDETVEVTSATSYWPFVLAIGLTATAFGIVFAWPQGALLIAVPLALVSARSWLALVLAGTQMEPAFKLPSAELSRHLAAGDAIAVENLGGRSLSRRSVLQIGLWSGLGLSLASSVGAVFSFLWERSPGTFGGRVIVGPADKFPPGSKTKIYEGKFWLIHLDESQGGTGFLALWQKCPHLGCTVPCDANHRRLDPDTKQTKTGWFICPCHQSTYNDAGVLVAGPAPRSMDRMALQIDPRTGVIEVDTGAIENGGPDNPLFAVRGPGE